MCQMLLSMDEENSAFTASGLLKLVHPENSGYMHYMHFRLLGIWYLKSGCECLR